MLMSRKYFYVQRRESGFVDMSSTPQRGKEGRPSGLKTDKKRAFFDGLPL